jgi:hypothetical protein
MTQQVTEQSLIDENWKDIIGYEGLYIISDQGNIISKAREWITGFGGKASHKDIPLKQRIVKGYARITLSKDDKEKEYFVHRLVMETFIGKSDLQVNHKNCIKSDNRLENLEYVTSKENVRHAILNGKFENFFKGKKIYNDKKKIKIYGINKKSGYITEIFNSVFEASILLEVHPGNIFGNLNGKRKSAHGYVWKKI